MPGKLIAVANIRRAVGLDGFVGLDALGETFRSLNLPAAVYLGKDDAHTTEVVMQEREDRPRGPIARFEGVTDRTAAESLEGLTVYVDEGTLPRLDEQRFYQFELAGMKVYTKENDYIGTVLSVSNFPSVDSIEIAYKNDSIFIPLTRESLIAIDKDKRTIVVDKKFLEEMF